MPYKSAEFSGHERCPRLNLLILMVAVLLMIAVAMLMSELAWRARGTLGLIGLATLVHMYIVSTGSEYEAIVGLGLSLASLREGRYYALILHPFIHANIQHLFFNMAALAVFGMIVELQMGTPFLLAVFLTTSILSGLASLPLIGENAISVGASGGIFGLMGCILAEDSTRMGVKALELTAAIFLAIGLWFIGANVVAHLTGLLLGLVVRAVSRRR